MPGASRNLLNKMNHLLHNHHIKCTGIRKKSVHGFWHLQRAQQDYIDLSQSFEKTIKSLIKAHLAYLDTPDPYNRIPSEEHILATNYKKRVFTHLLNTLEKSSGQRFPDMLHGELERLKNDPTIDHPRWPRLTLGNVYQLFMGKSKKEESQPPSTLKSKTRVKEKELKEPRSIGKKL